MENFYNVMGSQFPYQFDINMERKEHQKTINIYSLGKNTKVLLGPLQYVITDEMDSCHYNEDNEKKESLLFKCYIGDIFHKFDAKGHHSDPENNEYQGSLLKVWRAGITKEAIKEAQHLMAFQENTKYIVKCLGFYYIKKCYMMVLNVDCQNFRVMSNCLYTLCYTIPQSYICVCAIHEWCHNDLTTDTSLERIIYGLIMAIKHMTEKFYMYHAEICMRNVLIHRRTFQIKLINFQHVSTYYPGQIIQRFGNELTSKIVIPPELKRKKWTYDDQFISYAIGALIKDFVYGMKADDTNLAKCKRNLVLSTERIQNIFTASLIATDMNPFKRKHWNHFNDIL